VIIVEGPDGAGKSHLCAQITEYFGLMQGERGTSDRSKLYTVTVPDAYRAMNEAIRATKKPFVWDRMFFSEFMYYQLTGGECRFSEGQRQMFIRLMEVLAHPIILCLPPVSVCLENIKGDDDPKHKKFNDALPQIYVAYAHLYKWMPAQTIIYDYTTEPPDRVFQIVNAYLDLRRNREW
jgi:hypothetical protein